MIVSSQRTSLNKGDHFLQTSPLNQQRPLNVSESSTCLSDVSEKLDDDEKTNSQDTRELMLDMIWRENPLQTPHNDANRYLNYSSTSCFLNKIGEIDMWCNINETHTKNKQSSSNKLTLDVGSQSDLLHLNNLTTPIWSIKSSSPSTSNKKRAFNKINEEMPCVKYQCSNSYDIFPNETTMPLPVLPSTNNLITASSFVHCDDNSSNAKSFLKLESTQQHVTDGAENNLPSLPVVASFKKSKTCIEPVSLNSNNTISELKDIGSENDKKILNTSDTQEPSISEVYDSSECWLVSLSNNVLELQLKYLKEGNEKLRNQIKQNESESSFSAFKINDHVLDSTNSNSNFKNNSEQEKECHSLHSTLENMENLDTQKSESFSLTALEQDEESNVLPLKNSSITSNKQEKVNLTNTFDQYMNSCDTLEPKVDTEISFSLSQNIPENNSLEADCDNENEPKNQRSDIYTQNSETVFSAESKSKAGDLPSQNFSTHSSCEQLDKSLEVISEQTNKDRQETEFFSNAKESTAPFYSDDMNHEDDAQVSFTSDRSSIGSKTENVFNTDTKMDFSPSLLFSTCNDTNDSPLVSTTCHDSFFSEKRLESSLLTDTLSNPSPVLNNLLSRFVLCSNDKTNSFNTKRTTEKNVIERECLGIFDNYLNTNDLHDMGSYTESECANNLESFANGPESPNGNDLIDFNFVNFLQRVASPSSVLNKQFNSSLTTDLYSINDETDTFRTNDSAFHYLENNSDGSLSSINNSWNFNLSSEELNLSTKNVSEATTPLRSWSMEQSLNSLLCCDSDENKMVSGSEMNPYFSENRQKRIGPSCFRRPKTPSRITNFFDVPVAAPSCNMSPTGSCMNSMPRMIPILTPPTAMSSTRTLSPKSLSQSQVLRNDCEISSDIVDSAVKLQHSSINKKKHSNYSVSDSIISPPVISNSFSESSTTNSSCPRSDSIQLSPYCCSDLQESHVQHCLVQPTSSRVELPTSSSLVVLSYPPQESFEAPSVDNTTYDASISKNTTNSLPSTAITSGQMMSNDQDELQSLSVINYEKMVSWRDNYVKRSEPIFPLKSKPLEFSSSSDIRWHSREPNWTCFDHSLVATNETDSESTLKLSNANKLRNYNGITSNDLLSIESVNKNPLIHQIN